MKSLKLLTTLLLTPLLCGISLAQNEKSPLQTELETIVSNFRGDVGIYVRNLKTGETAAINADSLFPTASMIKVPIMIGVYDKIETGELSLNQQLPFDPDEINYPYTAGSVVASMRTGEKIEIKKLISMMLAFSDNHASLWLQALAGGGTRINELMEQNGFDQIKVNSRTEGRRGDWEKYGWGETTPKQMAELLVAIREGKVVSSKASESMYRFLSGSIFHDEAISEIPPFVNSATKQGAVNQARSEVLLVNAPSGDYVFCVATKNQEDQSWTHNNEGYLLIRTISKTLWNHFEPESNWRKGVKP